MQDRYNKQNVINRSKSLIWYVSDWGNNKASPQNKLEYNNKQRRGNKVFN